MIKLADDISAPQVRQMWKTCFGDTDEFMNLYFSEKYKNENTLVYFVDNKAVASLQMLPYTMSFYNEDISLAYISGACTLPEYRKNGYMEKLLIEAFGIIKRRSIPLSILIPAEEWLYDFYEKYGYIQTFEGSVTEFSLNYILSEYKDREKAYLAFEKIFENKEFYVKKTRRDFHTIVTSYLQEEPSMITNLSAMSRIIDAKYLLELFAANYKGTLFSIKVKDDILDSNSNTYLIDKGLCLEKEIAQPTFVMDIQTLCKLLLGYKVADLNTKYSIYFKEHNPIINLMLE